MLGRVGVGGVTGARRGFAEARSSVGGEDGGVNEREGEVMFEGGPFAESLGRGACTAERGVVVALLEKTGVGEAPRVVVEEEEEEEMEGEEVAELRAMGVMWVTVLEDAVGRGGVLGLDRIEECLPVEIGTVGGVEGALGGGEGGACAGRTGVGTAIGIGGAGVEAGVGAGVTGRGFADLAGRGEGLEAEEEGGAGATVTGF